MESQDEKAAQKERMLKESEMRDHAKLQGREIAKKRLENNYKRNEMEAISSADFAHNQPAPEEIPAKSIGGKSDDKDDTSTSTIKKTFEPPKENSFQKMLQESEIKSVKKKQPKKGMQLGKKK